MSQFPNVRMRRLRCQDAIRDLVKETQLNADQLIFPLFIHHGSQIKNPIGAMPGQFQYSLDILKEEITNCRELGIKAVLLFGIPEHKDSYGQIAYAADGIIQAAIRLIKQMAPEILVISDVCCCEYTDHGHCGVVTKTENGYEIDNDQTLPLLIKQALSHAEAGADIVAPSGMMDGMVSAIRQGLDEANFKNLPILSYSVKYASAMYGPFREAAGGTPQFGNRKSHQMNIHNTEEALRECALDIQEGADMLMVKPAHTYLDIITRVKNAYPALPLGAYHTSGEYAMIKAAAAQGWIDEKQTALEVLTSIKRAGADFIITYYAKDVAGWLNG